jgi:hypothetical protein
MQRLLCRVLVDPKTLEPVGEPKHIADGIMGDGFVINKGEGVAYVTTHWQNTIKRVLLELGKALVAIAG